MHHQEYRFQFEVYDSIHELAPEDAFLLAEARKTTALAYAPYSHFQVGAFARLNNGETVRGTNQENASYPAGICAERVLLSTASAMYPNEPIKTIAISYHNLNGESDRPVSPCGICRQSLAEQESRYKQPVRLILSGMEGKVYVVDKATSLLPMSFSGDDLK